MEAKLTLLNKINNEKTILFGTLSSSITKEDKIKKWQEVAELAMTLGLVNNKPWHYVRDTLWANWRKRTLARKMGINKGKKANINEMDKLIVEILGNDSVNKFMKACPFKSANETLMVDSNGEKSKNNMKEVCPYTSARDSLCKDAKEEIFMHDGKNCVEPELENVTEKRQKTVTETVEIKYLRMDNFPLEYDQGKSKKFLLEVEYLILRNHKTRLEILELEKKLNLPKSKFTEGLEAETIIVDADVDMFSDERS